MSESYCDHVFTGSRWLKLYQYLMFRRLTGGLWIGCKPETWYWILTQTHVHMTMTNHTDSGGGVFSSYHIVCRNGSWPSADVLYELSFKYEDGIENHGFDYAIDEAYYYMQSYMRGSSLADRARYFENKYCKDTKLKADEWMKVFSLDDDVSELPITKKDEVVHEHERNIPVDAFEYMAMEGRFEKGHIKPFKELRSQVVTAKQWAMIALLEMQRYHCTSC